MSASDCGLENAHVRNVRCAFLVLSFCSSHKSSALHVREALLLASVA